MKCIFLSILLGLSITVCVQAQIIANRPKFFPQGTHWVRSTENFGSQKWSGVVSCHTIKGSAVFEDKEYYVVETTKGESEDNLYIREAEEKVYVYYPNLKKEIMYYDFNWIEGQQIAFNEYITNSYYLFMSKEAVNVKLADGHTYLSLPSEGLVHTIGYVEGRSPFSLYYDVPDNCSRMFISSFVRNDVEIIQSPVSISPPKSKSDQSAWCDLFGRRLPTLPTRKGIYIKDGRKVLIK